MFEANYIKSNPDYDNFIRATTPSFIIPVLERGLKEIWGNGFKLNKLRIPRVSAAKDNGLLIQYELCAENIPYGIGDTIFICGKLLNQSKMFEKYSSKLKGEFIVVNEIGLIIPVFPNDLKLPALSNIHSILSNPEIVDKVSSKLNCKTPVSCDVSYNFIGYKLERRAVMRVNYEIVDDTGKTFSTTLIAKLLRTKSANRTYNSVKLFITLTVSRWSGINFASMIARERL